MVARRHPNRCSLGSPTWQNISNREGVSISTFGAMNADGTNVRQLTNTRSDDMAPAWSPDGTQIVFARKLETYNAYFGLWIMNADGTNRSATHRGDSNVGLEPRLVARRHPNRVH